MPCVFVNPGLAFVLGVLGYAVAGDVVLSLHESDMVLNKTSVGFKNYTATFHDLRFQTSLWTAVVFVLSSTVLAMTMSMVFALKLYYVGFSRRFIRGLSLVPYLVPAIAAAVTFRFIFTTSGGFVN